MILSVFFFINKRGFVLENKLLACLLMIFALQIFYSFATSTFAFMYFMEWHKPLFLLRQTSLLIGPLIYFYVNSFLKKQDFADSRSLLHFLPFIAAVIVLLFFYRQVHSFVIWESVLDLDFTILIP